MVAAKLCAEISKRMMAINFFDDFIFRFSFYVFEIAFIHVPPLRGFVNHFSIYHNDAPAELKTSMSFVHKSYVRESYVLRLNTDVRRAHRLRKSTEAMLHKNDLLLRDLSSFLPIQSSEIRWHTILQ